MDNKPWYKSKAKLAAIAAFALAGAQAYSTFSGHPVAVPDWAYKALGAIGLFGLRDAVSNSPKQ